MTDGAIICMAEHKAKGKNGIIYIIPNDELYEKWKKRGGIY